MHICALELRALQQHGNEISRDAIFSHTNKSVTAILKYNMRQLCFSDCGNDGLPQQADYCQPIYLSSFVWID